jgi:hypothetical protein
MISAGSKMAISAKVRTAQRKMRYL